MKMKEVCRRTGLTERAVRLYVQEGLLRPKSDYVRERTYLEFSEGDIDTLSAVAELRSAQFTLSEIARMEKEPGSIGGIVGEADARLTGLADQAKKASLALQSPEAKGAGDIFALASALRAGGREKSFAVLEPHFGRFDGVSPQEREEAVERFLISEEKRSRKRRAVLCLAAALALVAVTVFATLLAAGVLPGEKAPAAELDGAAQLVLTYTESAFETGLTDFRALVPEPQEGFYLEALGLGGLTEKPAAVYTDGNRAFTVWGRKLNDLEAQAVLDRGLTKGRLTGDADTPENRLQAILPGQNGGEYYILWLESEAVTEDVMGAACERGVKVFLPWGETVMVYP